MYVYFDTSHNTVFGAGICEIPPGSSNEKHVHGDADEIIYMLVGKLCFEFPDENITLEPFQAIYIPHGLEHQIFNVGDEKASHTFTFSSPEPATLIKQKYHKM